MNATKYLARPFVLLPLLALLHSPSGRANDIAQQLGYPEYVPWLHKSFGQAIQDLDRQIEESPEDVMLGVARCRMIQEYEYDEYTTTSPEPAWPSHSECLESLLNLYPLHPEVVLYSLESADSETQIKDGLTALRELQPAWTPFQTARLLALLGGAYAYTGDEAEARYYYYEAFLRDSRSPGRIYAAKRLHEISEADADTAAAALLMGRDMPEAGELWFEVLRVTTLLEFGQTETAIEHYRSLALGPDDYFDGQTLGEAFADAGLLDLAREVFQAAGQRSWAGGPVVAQQFQFEVEHGTPQAAYEQYRRLLEIDDSFDPLARARLRLAARDVALPWTSSDLSRAGVLLLVFAFVFLSPLLVLLPAHHRGLARRVRGITPTMQRFPWTLKTAWVSLGLWLVGLGLAYYAGAYDQFAGAVWDGNITDPYAHLWASDEGSLLETMVIAFIAILLALLAVAFVSGNVGALVWNKLSWRKTILVLSIAIPVQVALALLTIGFARANLATGQGLGTQALLMEALANHNIWWVLLFVSIVIPIVEEYVFRGALLGALSRNLSSFWSLVIQSVLFMLVHESLAALPAIFVFAMVAGELARRSEGLLVPILFHGIYNGVLISLVGLAIQ